jgi:hypothetical protein
VIAGVLVPIYNDIPAARSFPISINIFYAFIRLLLSGDIKSNPGPKLFSININSLRNKIDNLTAELVKEIDILAITETRINHTMPNNDVLLPGFSQIFGKDLTINSGDVCLQLTGQLIGRHLPNLEQPDLELQWVKVACDCLFLIVGCQKPCPSSILLG